MPSFIGDPVNVAKTRAETTSAGQTVAYTNPKTESDVIFGGTYRSAIPITL